MNISQNVDIKNTQKLILTQQMKASIDILQMNCMELKSRIDQELLENPVLEFNENDMEEMSVKGEEAENRKESEDQIDWDTYFEKQQNGTIPEGRTAPEDQDDFNFEKFSSREMTLKDFLMLQLHVLSEELTDEEMALGEAIIEEIDGDGYLFADVAAIAADNGAGPEMGEKVLKRIQEFDPAGVGARNIGECLAIQLRGLGLMTDNRQMLLDDYLLEVANSQFKKVAEATGLPVEEVAAFKMQIKELNPRPGTAFSANETPEYIVPDGRVEWVEDELFVHINEVSAPRLKISRFYRQMLSERGSNEEVKAYINKKMDAAMFLVKCIDARRETIRRIITSIATYQEKYLRSQSPHPLALTMKEIADMAGVHESTVSRAVRGKYISTPRGTFAMKDFFKRGYRHGGEDVSSDGIKNAIRDIIEGEDTHRPFSDQKIVDVLKDSGVTVARRTVAKYREAMGIPTSTQRKTM